MLIHLKLQTESVIVTSARSLFLAIMQGDPSPSGSGTASPISRGQRRRQPGNNTTLRTYYGLSADDQHQQQQEDPTDADGTAFNVDLAFDKLLRTQSLSRLLKEESDLLTSIRELDGERQSLVYNHHHELVSASETMRKMKERADTLLPSLDSLQTSLQSISTITDTISATKKETQPSSDLDARLNTSVRTIVELPRRLRDLIVLGDSTTALGGAAGESGLSKAQGLWGSMESVLAAWNEAGISGAKEIMQNCRQILREASQENTALSVKT